MYCMHKQDTTGASVASVPKEKEAKGFRVLTAHHTELGGHRPASFAVQEFNKFKV